MYTCAVRGYDQLQRRPSDWLLCPCCRTKFGYSDVGRPLEELRGEGIADGAKRGSTYAPRPPIKVVPGCSAQEHWVYPRHWRKQTSCLALTAKALL